MFRKVLYGLKILLILGVALFGWGQYQRVTLVNSTPPPGQMVDMIDYQLHLDCKGEGPVTVLLEAGSNEFSLTWDKVFLELSKQTQVCRYDRAGLGWSKASPIPRMASSMADEFQDLLKQAKILPPYIFVGHSYGGYIGQWFAYRYPESLAALLLIDSAHVDQFIRIPSAQAELDGLVDQFTTLQRVSRMGLMAMRPATIPERGFSGETLRQYRGVLASRNHFLAAMEENKLVRESLEEGVQVLNHIDVPVVVITRGRADGLDDEEFASWQLMQRNLLTVSVRSKQVIARQSGHYIQMDQPELVIQEIKLLLQQ
ncbi:Pimeloyl-ACP methyl ester carboxylesterase [Mariprofundus aestuarium]|uniref:Pimeloyl-ACP methyl ester carboxylesterase n=1 Tax=Mariprofundus aestuarium TaxID=1921086 RepID=A0A2K8KY73_MARES|nr:alpha/beta hydrolase [Mariprofundus aestuarium]ATX78829.1 Pimeloyl-ACP methyl ester carboxylesterase [Mariprofundus aestuarium]